MTQSTRTFKSRKNSAKILPQPEAKGAYGTDNEYRLPTYKGIFATLFYSEPRKGTFSKTKFITKYKENGNIVQKILVTVLAAIVDFFQKNVFIITAFLIPYIMMLMAFKNMEVAPYGDKQLLVTDLWHQYYPFLVDYQDKLKNGESLLWSWTQGGGTNYLALASYYLTSPLKLLTAFVSYEDLMSFLTYSVAFRIGLAGLFCAIFLRYAYKRDGLSLVIFTTAYALSAFFMGYYWCEIWLDTAALTPLVVTGFLALMREGKFKLYILSLAISILANYYIGLFTCIFMVLCFIGYQFCTWKGFTWASFKRFFVDFGKIAGCSVIAIMMTLFLMLPAFFGLQTTNAVDSKMPETYQTNFGVTDDVNGTVEALQKLLGNTMAELEPATKEADSLPNIACGSIALVFAILFFTSSKIKVREKIFFGGLLLFLMMSFIDRRLDYMWHGFHFTNMIPYRFSYLFSFVVVAMAFRAFTKMNYMNYLELIIGGFITIVVFMLCKEVQPNKEAFETTAIMAGIIFVLLILHTSSIAVKPIICATLVVMMLVQGTATAQIGVETTTVTSRADYPRGGKNTEDVIEYMKDREEKKGTTEMYRADFTSTQTLCDPSLNRINGISMFNSMTNADITLFMENFGLMGWLSGNRYTYAESSPVSNLFMNMKYVIARDGNVNNTRYLSEVFSSGSVSLTENKSYIPMGFVTNTDLLEWSGTDPEGTVNPFEKQNQFFSMATGIQKDVYVQLDVVSQGHTTYEDFPVNRRDYGYYTFSCNNSSITPHLKWNYTAPKDGYYYAYVQISNEDRVTVKCNDAARTGTSSFYIKRPYIMSIGYFNKGDKISIYSDLNTNASGSAKVYVNMLNEKVYEKGVEKLQESVMKTTELTGSSMKGTIDVKEDGLFYTSIPFEDGKTDNEKLIGKLFGLKNEGWTAYVDGKEVEIKTVGNAMVAFEIEKGQHNIEIKYVPKGFTRGTLISVAALGIFVGLCVVEAVLKFKKRRKTANETVAQVGTSAE